MQVLHKQPQMHHYFLWKPAHIQMLAGVQSQQIVCGYFKNIGQLQQLLRFRISLIVFPLAD